MAYKSLNDRLRQDALPMFLSAADTLTGLICTIAVDKRYQWMATSPKTLAILVQQKTLVGKWGAPAFEAMGRAVLIWLSMLEILCSTNQNISWILDEDDIAANDGRLTDLLEYAGRISSLFINSPMKELAINTSAIDTGDRGFEDFLAIPDLCAGTIADIVNNWLPLSLKDVDQNHVWQASHPKADYLSDWYFAETARLRRIAIAIMSTPEGMRVQRINPGGFVED